MPPQKVADMTVEELKDLIRQVIAEQLTPQPIDKVKLKQVMESIEQHRWTPPPGAPSVVEMLREDRDR